MNREDTVGILRMRWSLTDQKFNDDTADAWQEVLEGWTYRETRVALIAAAKEHQRISVTHLVEKLPQRHIVAAPMDPCELCGGDGWVTVTGEAAHNPRYCRPDDEHPCFCHATVPCQCTQGRRNVDVADRIVTANDRALGRRPEPAASPPPAEPGPEQQEIAL